MFSCCGEVFPAVAGVPHATPSLRFPSVFANVTVLSCCGEVFPAVAATATVSPPSWLSSGCGKVFLFTKNARCGCCPDRATVDNNGFEEETDFIEPLAVGCFS